MTELDEAIIRWTVRVAMLFYGGFVLVSWCRFKRSLVLARWFWTLGLSFFLLHLMAAFGLYHDWSHLHAYEHTANRTFEVIGWRWGGGLYFNYLLTVVWLVDVGLWWWFGLDWPSRSIGYQRALHAFFAFMVLNATVIFGPRVWVGLGILFAAIFWIGRHIGKPKSLR